MSEIKNTVAEQLQQLQMLVHRANFHEFTGSGKKHNPHRGQGRVLVLLKMNPQISQKELAYLLGISKQALAELLVKLEKGGYITRQTSENDRRIINIKLTDEGIKAADDLGDDSSETTRVLDCLNDNELKILSEYLDRIIKRYYDEQFPDMDLEGRRKVMEKIMLKYSYHFDKDYSKLHSGKRKKQDK